MSKVLVAILLSFLTLVSPLAPLSAMAADDGARRRPAGETAGQSAAGEGREAGYVPLPAPVAMLLQGTPNIVATKVDAFPDPNGDGKAALGETITYTVTLTNTGTADATGVQFSDTIDANTTLVPGSINTQPIAVPDTYNVVGNVRIQPNAAQGLFANDRDPDTGNTTGLTITTAPTTSTQGGNVNINTTDGSFTYNPAPGFAGTDTFSYTVTDSGGKTDTATVTLNVGNGTSTPGNNVIWFVNPAAAAGGDGRLTSPFNCYTGTTTGGQTCFSDTAADDTGDFIFLYAGSHTGGYTLLNNEKLIGAGASQSLALIGPFTVEPYSDPLPATDGNQAGVTITTTVAATNAVNIGVGNSNLLRGFTIGNTTGSKIASTASGFGTLTASEVTLTGNGQALNLDSGALAATFTSISSNLSGGPGVNLDQVSGTLTATNGTTVTDPATQCVLVTASTANITFNNTACSDATDGISLQNNSAGTRSFGSLSVTNGTGAGFVHANGGGITTVSGATTITNPAGVGIDIDSSNADISFAATTVNKNSTGGIGVDLTSNAGRTIGFTSLTVTTTNAFALNTNNSGTVNAGGGSLTQSGAGGGAASLTNTALGLTFTSVSSNGGGNGLIFSGGSGTFASGSTNLQNNAGVGLSMSSTAVAANFGNTIVNSSAGDGVDLSGNSGNITFADLDITPDANLRGLDAANNTGTITTTSGDIATTGAQAIDISGPAGRTPLAMVLTNVDSTNSTTFGLNINLVSGSFTVNDPGVAVNITNSTDTGLQVQNSTATFSFGNTNVSGTGNGNVNAAGTGVLLNNNNTASITFVDLDIAPDSGERALHATDSDGASAASTITTSSGTITTTNNTAVEISGATSAARTPLNVQLTTVNTTGGSVAANGIALTNTSTTGSPGGFRVLGTGGTCTFATPTCSGGRITATTGAGDATPENNGGIGVRLNNANQVFLTRMRIDNHPNFAVHGTGVVGFNLDASVLDGANGNEAAFEEGAIGFRELTGTSGAGTASSISNSFIGGGREFLIDVRNFNGGTLNRLTISNNTIGDLDGAGAGFGLHASDGDDAIHLEGFGSAATFNVTVSNNVLNNGRGDTVNYNVGTTGNNPINSDFVLRNNTMHNVHPAILSGGGGVTVTMGGGATVNSTYDISCNSIRGAKGHSLLVAKTLGNGTAQGTIFNNRMGLDGSVNSGSSEASGIDVDTRGAGTHTVLIKNNQVHNWGANGAIQIFNNQGSATMNVTVQGNLSNNPDNEGLAGLYAEVGALAADTSILNLIVGGAGANENNFVEGDFFNGNDVLLSRIAGSGTQLNLSRGVSAASTVQQVITDNNVDPVTAAGAGTITFVNTTPALPPAVDQTCIPPTNPDGNFVEEPGGQIGGPVEEEPPAQAANTVEPAAQTQQQTAQPVAASVEQVASAEQTASASVARATEWSDIEPSRRGLKPAASADAAVFFGAMADAPARTARTVRASYTAEGESAPARTAKTSTHAADTSQSNATANALPRPAAMLVRRAGETVSVNIGTLRPNDPVTITFQVTVNDPLPAGTTQVSNQGTINYGPGTLSTVTDDPGTGAPNDATATPIETPVDVFVRDATGPEPASGTNNMVFTVALSSVSGSTITVNFATADGGPNPATAGTCGSGGDYVATSGTLTFLAGQTVQSVSVPVCSDAVSDDNETFLLNLTGATNANVANPPADNQATGTITPNTPGEVLISELRTSGPGGTADDFVEIYNNSDSPVTLNAVDSSAGWSIVKMGAACTDTPVVVGIIANGTVIPARGHYLFVGTAYSLGSYPAGSGTTATGNLTLSADIENDRNVALFKTSDVANLSSVNRADAVGFGLNTSNNCDLLRESSTLANASGSTSEYSFHRNLITGKPKDSNDNSADFLLVSTTPATPVGDNAAPRLGAPGPENLSSPLLRTAQFQSNFVDPGSCSSCSPNRVRDTTPGPAATSSLGTLAIRRQFVNNTGGPVTRLRFRIIDVTTFPSPTGTADMRAITSSNVTVTRADSSMVTVLGTTLETPPAQPNGGGLHSTLAAGTITTATPLANGAAINVQWVLGVQQSGSFRFFVIVEALP